MSETPRIDQLDQSLQVEINAALQRKEEFSVIIVETLGKLYKRARDLEKENQRLREFARHKGSCPVDRDTDGACACGFDKLNAGVGG